MSQINMPPDGLWHWKVKLLYLIFYTILITASTLVGINHAKVISKSMLCVDSKCEELYANGRTMGKYQKESEEMLYFKKDSNVKIFGKTEDDKQLFVEINKKRGFVPRNLVQENKIFNSNLTTKVEIDIDKVRSDLQTIPNTNTPEASFNGNSVGISPSIIQKTPTLDDSSSTTVERSLSADASSTVASSYLYSSKSFTVIDGTTINDGDILQTPSPTFSNNIENTKTPTVEVNFNANEIVPSAGPKPIISIDNNNNPNNVQNNTLFVEDGSVNNVSQGNVNINDVKPVLDVNNSTGQETLETEDVIDEEVQNKVTVKEDHNAPTLEMEKMVDGKQMDNNENVLLTNNLHDKVDHHQAKDADSSDNIMINNNTNKLEESVSIDSKVEGNKSNIEMENIIIPEEAKKDSIDNQADDNLDAFVNDTNHNELENENHSIVENVTEPNVKAADTLPQLEEEEEVNQPNTSSEQHNDDIVVEKVLPLAVEDSIKPLIDNSYLSVDSINSTNAVNQSSPVKDSAKFTDNISSLLSPSPSSGMVNDDDKKETILNTVSSSLPNSVPDNSNIPKIPMGRFKLNRMPNQEPPTPLPIIDQVSMNENGNSHAIPNIQVEKSSDQLLQNDHQNIDQMPNSNFEANAQEIYRTPHRFGSINTNQQAEAIVSSSENLRNHNRNDNLHNDNLHNDNLHNDNLHNDNLHDDNLHNDNLRNDNLRNDNLRNDNLRNDNLHNENLHNENHRNKNHHQHSPLTNRANNNHLTKPNHAPVGLINTETNDFFRVIKDVIPDEVQLFFENYPLPQHALIFFSITCLFWCLMNYFIHSLNKRNLRELLNHAQRRMFHLEGEKGELVAKISLQKDQLSRMSNDFNKADTKLIDYQLQFEQLKNENSNLNKEIQSMSAKMHTTSQINSKLESVLKENECLKMKNQEQSILIVELEEKAEIIVKLEKSNRSKEEEIEDLHEKNKSLLEENEQFKFSLKDIEQNFEVVELENKELKMLRNQLTDEVKNYKDEILSFEEKVKHLTQKCQQLNEALMESNNKSATFETKLEEKINEIFAMKTLLGKLNKSINKEQLRRQFSNDSNGEMVVDDEKDDGLSTLSTSMDDVDNTKQSNHSLKNNEDGMDNEFQDIVKLQIRVANLECENQNLQKQLNELEKMKEENVELKEKANKAESERATAVIERDTIIKYFNERELNFSKEIGVQISERERKENDADAFERKYKDAQMEIVRLSEKLTQTETRYKMEVIQLEKQSHENWISLRDFQKKYDEARTEAAVLRQTLAEFVRSPPVSNADLSLSYLNDSASSISSLPDGMNLSGTFPPPPPPPPLPMMLSPMLSHMASMPPASMYGDSIDSNANSAPVWNPPIIQGMTLPPLAPTTTATYSGPQSLDTSTAYRSDAPLNDSQSPRPASYLQYI